MSIPSLLNPQNPKFLFLVHHSSSSPHHTLFPIQTINYPTKKIFSFPPSLQSSSLSLPIQNDDVLFDDDEDRVIGDCLVFEEGIFEDPYLETESGVHVSTRKEKPRSKNKKRNELEIETENLVPDKWREAQAEINITKKQRRKIAQEMQLNCRVEKKKKALLPIRSLNLDEYKAYKEAKLAQLKPLMLDDPKNLNFKEGEEEKEKLEINGSERVKPKNPRWAVYGKGFDYVTEFFNSGNYEPGTKKSEGPRKLFSKEEKVLLNKKIPDLSAASSSKWLPLQTLAASGEFYLMDALLKHNVDINALNVDGLTALHKAIICKKQAITSYLLRESANPFVQDSDGATLLHYAVQTASAPAVKLLLLYNVDINLPDKYGWTPLHVAVQAQRTDIVKLLLIKGADREIKNQDGLTPLDLCLYCGKSTRVYELIKLLKQYPKKRTVSRSRQQISPCSEFA